MSMNNWKALPTLATLCLVTLTAACGDMTAPTASTPTVLPNAPKFSNVQWVGVTGDTTVQQFTVQPGWGDTFTLAGTHIVELVQGSVCDPAVSSYGVGEWEKPCTVISKPLTFTAKSWTDENGHPRVTFSPDVRFAPGKVNTMWLKDRQASADPTYKIDWCSSSRTSCVDESLADPAVATRRDAANGRLYRRVKHFSGYTVTAD